MMANGRLARAVADVGLFEFGRQLAYKAAMTGARVVMADRWFASSKTCSACGHVHDRDRNAAINLMHLAASSAVTACGEDGADVSPRTAVKPASVKQEPE